MLRRLAFVALVALLVCGLVEAADDKGKKVKKGAVYNTSQVLLEVSAPIVLTVMTGEKKVLGKAELPTDPAKYGATGETKTEGNLVTNTMTVSYKNPVTLSNSSGQLSNVKVKIVTTLYKNTSYWKISDMTVSYNGKYTANDESLWVDKVPGFLKQGPWNCARDFTSCAPMSLSWTCDGQQFSAKALDEKSAAQGTVLTFPGMELQPLYDGAQGAKIRFGFNWDCDPLITSALWVTLLLGLALIVALYWSCDMITSLTTPDRFDDPKKTQPIMVPSAE